MAKFCSWCGEALEPGARYCPECGARVLESVKVDGSADSVDPMRGFDIVGGEALPADKTIKIDRDRDPADTDTLVLPTDNAQKRFVLDDTPKKSRAALAACVAVILVLLAVVAGLFWLQSNAHQGAQEDDSSVEDSGQDQESDVQDDSEDQDEPTISDTVVDSESLSDDEVFALLDEAYDRLSSYDERIAECVEDFNGLFLARSMDDREAAKEKADDLLSELNEELTALEELLIPASSPYCDDAEAVIELYSCQVGRVQSLADAWALDVTFDVPSQHKEEILEVLAESNEGGTNKYLTRYNELYPTAKPQQE